MGVVDDRLGAFGGGTIESLTPLIIIDSPESGNVSGIPVPSNTFQKVQLRILEITQSRTHLCAEPIPGTDE